MVEIEKNEILLSNLSDKVKELNKLLLYVKWENTNFDMEDFNCGISIDDPRLSREQNNLIKLLVDSIPEWGRLLGCKQHNIHDYCLDIHTLSVVKKIHEQRGFLALNNYHKLITLYSALLHDISKNENEVDHSHPLKGAKASSSILFRLGFGEDFINSVYLLIKYHQFLGLLVCEKVDLNKEQIKEMFDKPILVDLQKFLSIADIKSVKKNESFYDKSMDEKFDKVSEEIKSFI